MSSDDIAMICDVFIVWMMLFVMNFGIHTQHTCIQTQQTPFTYIHYMHACIHTCIILVDGFIGPGDDPAHAPHAALSPGWFEGAGAHVPLRSACCPWLWRVSHCGRLPRCRRASWLGETARAATVVKLMRMLRGIDRLAAAETF